MWPLRCSRRKPFVFQNAPFRVGLLLDISLTNARFKGDSLSLVFRIANLDLDPAGQNPWVLTAEGNSVEFPLTPSPQRREIKVVKPHDRLVLVSSAPCSASTPSLSTTWSMWGLQETEVSGMPYLEVGFPLRCFQRLSVPDIATRQCNWRYNRHTSGRSIPVLSY